MAKPPKDTKGPVVRTGPTAGQNRSRNNDGRWRAKRSDAGKPRGKDSQNSSNSGGKKGCFLTTAACDLRNLPDDCYELTILRAFRDEVLLSSEGGRALVEKYYNLAPQLTPLVSQPDLKDVVWGKIQQTVSHISAGDTEQAVAEYSSLMALLLERSQTTSRD